MNRAVAAPVKSRFLLNHAGDCRFLDPDDRLPVIKDPKRRRHPMPSKDGFAPDHPLPLFLSEHAEQPRRPGSGKARDRAVSSRILKTGIVVVTAAAIDFAILSVGNPVALFASVTASLVDASALQPTAGAQGLQPTARQEPTRD